MASQKSIHKEICEIEKQVGILSLRLKVIQNKCKHPNVEKTHRSDTGNWCKLDDCYWTEFSCPDCKKQWMEDGSL